MIAYFETSALVKTFVDEEGSDLARSLWDQAALIATSLLTYAEARAALAAAKRGGRLSPRSLTLAKRQLESWFDEMHLIGVRRGTVRRAGDVAEASELRGYDAIHLASALELETDDVVFVTWDRELAQAARNAGLFQAGIVSRS